MTRSPRRGAVVVGAGITGLSTAWFLQEHGVSVTVLDRAEPGSGASWGNAGWLSPGLAFPLNEPRTLGYGLRSLYDRDAALRIPLRPDPRLWAFLARFAMHCTTRRWQRGMTHLTRLSRSALDAYDQLIVGGVRASSSAGAHVAAFASPAVARLVRDELRMVAEAGIDVAVEELSGDEARSAVPQLSHRVGSALRLRGHRTVEPAGFVQALRRAVTARGGSVRDHVEVRALRPTGSGVRATTDAGESVVADTAVLATGSWLPTLASGTGIRIRVQSGRGYSFCVDTSEPAHVPMYFPEARVVCTPHGGRLRVVGTMEFRPPDAPLDVRRIDAIARSTAPLVSGVDWHARYDEWVGPRPMSSDGLPLIGATALPGVFVAGGHGMWGMTHGPVTGRLLAEQIVTGSVPSDLVPFDPLR